FFLRCFRVCEYCLRRVICRLECLCRLRCAASDLACILIRQRDHFLQLALVNCFQLKLILRCVQVIQSLVDLILKSVLIGKHFRCSCDRFFHHLPALVCIDAQVHGSCQIICQLQFCRISFVVQQMYFLKQFVISRVYLCLHSVLICIYSLCLCKSRLEQCLYSRYYI